ncbi:MAG: NAD(P)H-dependent oxidoreductase [Desulfatiglans sp.]|jgi:multimeric flavodoxin WrbA|nr:NAD(P)H-dependent oxidoreductase [Thermodesulfobacteriota bacterium]MEE4352979.1 NAD(P)H-dependent oxidoreductase [Desulfatiglans sp.]
MFVLGLQGSPRKKGNTSLLLSAFLDQAAKLGAETESLDVSQEKILPCIECGMCEREGFCSIQDNMQEVYFKLRRADIVVMGTPIFFYGPTAQLKALIDRSQAMWARRYVHKVHDPLSKWRQGHVLAVGATKGDNLFEGLILTAKYFFDAIGARYEGLSGYREIEGPGEIKAHPTALEDVKKKAEALLSPLMKRERILFICRENACRSQMASAFAQHMAGDAIEAVSAGSDPAERINPLMMEVMAEKGIDMAYRRPRSIEAVLGHFQPNMVVSMGCGDKCPYLPGVQTREWDLEDPAGRSLEFMRGIRDDIEERVKRLL